MPVNVSSSSPVVDVVVGLGAILLLLSIFTMQIQEWISQQYNLRAKFLEQSIQSMLKDPHLVEEFYNHPFIQILSFVDKHGVVKRPAYIPSRMFAIAVFDILINVDRSNEEIQIGSIALPEIRHNIQSVQEKNPALAQLLNRIFSEHYKKINSPEDEIYEARANLETWFNNGMDRLTSWYREYTQRSVFLIAIVLALLLNIDPISSGIFLWREPTIRAALAQNAASFELSDEDLEANPEEALQNFRNQFVGLSLPIGWYSSRMPVTAFAESNCQLFPSMSQAFGIPIIGSNLCITPPHSNNQMNIFLKLSGLLIAALVVRIGAPFCFDVWKRLSDLRSSGKNSTEKEEK